MLEHYLNLGVDSCIINIHLAHPRDPVLDEVRAIAGRFNATIAHVVIGPWLLSVNPELYSRSRAGNPDDWFLLADQDELQVYGGNLRKILAKCDERGWRYVTGCFIDRISADGSLAGILNDLPLWERFPLGGWISYPLFGATPNKVVAVKGEAAVSGGQHWPVPVNAPTCPAELCYAQVHHFKWVEGLLERLRSRVAVRRGNGQPYWQESQRVLDYLGAHGDRFDLSDPALYIKKCTPEYGSWLTVGALAQQIAARYILACRASRHQ